MRLLDSPLKPSESWPVQSLPRVDSALTHRDRRCHQGVSIIYDTVSNLSWSVNIANHGIVTVIESVLNKTWLPSEEMGLEVPVAHPEEDCVVRWYIGRLFTRSG